MTMADDAAANDPGSWKGDLFTVVIAGPGQLRWGIIVRAEDEPSALAMVEARGHQVFAVRKGTEKGQAATKLTLGNCIACKYSLADLPAGNAGEVMCPECGLVNLPTAPLEARMGVLLRRRTRMRLWLYGWLGLFAVIIILLVALGAV